jgi:hypothetical protein
VLSWTYVRRASGWAMASGAVLMAGLFLVELLLASSLMLRTGSWGFSYWQWMLARLLFETITEQALLPHLMLSWALWLVLARLVPALDGSWRWICSATPLVAALCFPVIAECSISAWTPESGASYLGVLCLMSGGTSAALLLTRGLARSLAPEAFTRR